ncbi:MAG: S41 family peptidase [Lachnospiraceae bacterium]|nr:S41 family peptidase [Lachnospiraceae bacterium]
MNEIEIERMEAKPAKGGAVKFITGLLIGFLAAVLITGYSLNLYYGKQRQQYEETFKAYSEKINEMGKLDDGAVNTIIDQEFADKVGDICDIINGTYYFSDEFKPEETREKIYAAIMDSIGDKYSYYYTAREWEDEQADSAGTYYGIGSYVEIDQDSRYPRLSGVFEDSPAQKAGLRDGDLIAEVNGEDVNGWELSDVVAKIRGPENTDVNLTVIRGTERLSITVTRGKVNSIAVKYEVKRDNIGYIQLTQFTTAAEQQFADALSSLKKQKVKGIVLDLRSNPGGNLSTVLNIGEQLLPYGRITYIEDREGNKEEYYSTGKNEINIPMVVLVNEYSASASELLTGALRDYKKATIIGTNTYGKGIVQSIYPLADGSAVKITTASYFTPNGECIHGKGIAPDVEIEFDSELYYDEENPVDNQLECAIDYLLK